MVKKKINQEDDEPTARNLRQSQKRLNLVNHISSDLKGEHLAQMLAVLPESAFNRRPKQLYGFVVQETEVSLTSFSLLNDRYLDDLREGSLPGEFCAEMKYSTSCNILSQQGRLVEMSAIYQQ